MFVAGATEEANGSGEVGSAERAGIPAGRTGRGRPSARPARHTPAQTRPPGKWLVGASLGSRTGHTPHTGRRK